MYHERIVKMSRIAISITWAIAAVLVIWIVATATAEPAATTYVTYYPDGGVESVQSLDCDGKRHGQCRYYYETGKVMSLKNFEHGTAISFAHYSLDGSLLTESAEEPGYMMISKDYPAQ